MTTEHIFWLGASFLAGTTLGGGLGYLAWQQEKRLREFWRNEAARIAQRERTESEGRWARDGKTQAQEYGYRALRAYPTRGQK